MTRHIEFANIHNFRDVGGYAASDGRTIRWQRLYRADSLSWLTGDDAERFRALMVRTVIDLRGPDEVRQRGRAPETEGQRYHNLPVEGRPWNIRQFDPEVGLGRFFADRYLEVTEDGVDNLRTAIETIAKADSAPVVVHCVAGKDRTGLLIALVLALAGVAEDDIVADYALTGLATERFIADGPRKYPDHPIWPGFGVAPAEAMWLFLTDMAARHGSVEGYCRKILGLDAATIEDLRANLTDPIPGG